MGKQKIILKIMFVLFLLIGILTLQPQISSFANSEIQEETVQEINNENITEETVEKELTQEEIITQEPQESQELQEFQESQESQEEPQKDSEIIPQESQNEVQKKPQVELQAEAQSETQEKSEVEITKDTKKSVETTKTTTKSRMRSPQLQNTNKSTDDEIEIETADDFNTVLTNLNTNGGSKAIKLKNNIALNNQNPQLRKGELTILGEGYTLVASISVLENGILNLGKKMYEKTLDILPGRSDLCVINVDGNGILNIHEGVTIRDCTRAGQAGGITCFSNSTVNMYDGTITNCRSYAVSGGIYLDGHSVFNMYGGAISNCRGSNGGAIGLSGGSAIGPSTAGPVTFNMYGGLISNCVDDYMGGGAICAYSSYPVTINITGGKIENCKTIATSRYAYGGGAISTFCFSDLFFNMKGGEITGNSCVDCNRGYGGGILIYATGSNTNIQLTNGKITNNNANIGGGFFLYGGIANIADGFGMYNNTAIDEGDDFYNAFGTITLGAVNTTAKLEPCGHLITNWYQDEEGARWGYNECTGEDHLIPYEYIGVQYNGMFGVKAAHAEPIVEPDEPDEPIIEPEEPEEPDKPNEFNEQPAEPNKPIEQDKPIESTKITIPNNSIEPTQPIVVSIKPVKSTQTTKQIKPEVQPVIQSNANAPATQTEPLIIITETTPSTTKDESTITIISDSNVPQVEPEKYWALLNFILTILTFIFGLVFIIYKKNKETTKINNKKVNKNKLIAAIIALISIITFILTEDITTTMTWFDKWTILMTIIFICECVCNYRIYKTSE